MSTSGLELCDWDSASERSRSLCEWSREGSVQLANSVDGGRMNKNLEAPIERTAVDSSRLLDVSLIACSPLVTRGTDSSATSSQRPIIGITTPAHKWGLRDTGSHRATSPGTCKKRFPFGAERLRHSSDTAPTNDLRRSPRKRIAPIAETSISLLARQQKILHVRLPLRKVGVFFT